MVALIVIIVASFYHVQFSELFSLSASTEVRLYRLGMFWAAGIGGYGVVAAAFGLVLSPRKDDDLVRLMPVSIAATALILFFFYLLSASIDAPARDEQRRVRPGETITI